MKMSCLRGRESAPQTSQPSAELRICGVDSPPLYEPTPVTATTMMCDLNHSMPSKNDIMFRPMFCGQA